VNITLGTHHGCIGDESCSKLASELYATLSTGNYDWPVSILPLSDLESYLAAHRTARKRANRSLRLGYKFRPIDRCDHVDDIYRINTSVPERQGRPMSAGYLERPSFTPLPVFLCPRHRIQAYGVLSPSGHLVAYLVAYTVGELVLISQILGHADHLVADVMYLLTLGTLRDTLEHSGAATVFYNRHDSGTDGLRFFKERLGFAPERVEWALA
jgi:hypothetical protein